ncbi:hypothetical protein [Chachezhania sediminis]|uniref:hypothetical protein n=1 Tax=Chachezhania sediminis TaxID=2599291 RepID=UPI003898D5D5
MPADDLDSLLIANPGASEGIGASPEWLVSQARRAIARGGSALSSFRNLNRNERVSTEDRSVVVTVDEWLSAEVAPEDLPEREFVQGRSGKSMFLLVVVAAELAIDLHLPDAVSFAHLNPISPRWPVHGRLLCSFASRRLGLLIGHVLLLRVGRARFSDEHHGANEFFRVVDGFAVVMFVPGHTHRLDEPCSQMIDEPRLRAGHVGDQSLQDSFVGQHTPFEVGRLGGSYRRAGDAPREIATGSAPGANMCQRQPNDPEVQEEKSFDWSGLNSKGPSTVMSDGSANIAETRDDHAVDQIDGDVFQPVHLAGIRRRFARG